MVVEFQTGLPSLWQHGRLPQSSHQSVPAHVGRLAAALPRADRGVVAAARTCPPYASLAKALPGSRKNLRRKKNRRQKLKKEAGPMERHGRAHGAPVLPRAPARSPVWARSQTCGPPWGSRGPGFCVSFLPIVKIFMGPASAIYSRVVVRKGVTTNRHPACLLSLQAAVLRSQL